MTLIGWRGRPRLLLGLSRNSEERSGESAFKRFDLKWVFVVFVAYFVMGIFQKYAIYPIEAKLLPLYSQYASLIFLPHAVMIFVTGRTKRAIEDHFDRNPDLEASLGAKGKDDVREMVRSIIPEGINCVFVH